MATETEMKQLDKVLRGMIDRGQNHEASALARLMAAFAIGMGQEAMEALAVLGPAIEARAAAADTWPGPASIN